MWSVAKLASLCSMQHSLNKALTKAMPGSNTPTVALWGQLGWGGDAVGTAVLDLVALLKVCKYLMCKYLMTSPGFTLQSCIIVEQVALCKHAHGLKGKCIVAAMSDKMQQQHASALNAIAPECYFLHGISHSQARPNNSASQEDSMAIGGMHPQ